MKTFGRLYTTGTKALVLNVFTVRVLHIRKRKTGKRRDNKREFACSALACFVIVSIGSYG